jgi:hypothetical protein
MNGHLICIASTWRVALRNSSNGLATSALPCPSVYDALSLGYLGLH